MKLSQKAATQLEQFKPLLSFVPTPVSKTFFHLPHNKIGLFTGNQFGKTNSAMYGYVLRFLGLHPVPKKNVLYFECDGCGRTFSDSVLRALIRKEILRPDDNICPDCGGKVKIHNRVTRTFRMCAETMPQEKSTEGAKDSRETRNTVYPALKTWLPGFLIEKDITFRVPVMTIKDVNAGVKFGNQTYKGGDIIVEFLSYHQTVQAGAGVQRLSIYSDEEPPYAFYEEQLPRLLAEDGDFIIGLTPANRLTWTYDDFYEKAEVIYRTQAVCDYLNSIERVTERKLIEETGLDTGIAVIQAATDDNPTMKQEVVDSLFRAIDDPDVEAIRRYGIHRQVQGRIFKDFNPKIHVYDPETYFPGEPNFPYHNFKHFRMIDYHEHNPWAILWAALSPDNELFVYHEFAPSPDKYVTMAIVEKMAGVSGDYKYHFNLIDPLANKKQSNTGKTVVEDLNRLFNEQRREGICTGGYWEPWDTKSTRGRDAVRERIKNSRAVEQPFANHVVNDGKESHLPTIWISSTCRETIKSLRNWRLEEWAPGHANQEKERKETPQQKHSHFCMCLEALMKDVRFRPGPHRGMIPPPKKAPTYFKRR